MIPRTFKILSALSNKIKIPKMLNNALAPEPKQQQQCQTIIIFPPSY